MPSDNITNEEVFNAIDAALKEIGLVHTVGYDTSDGGIANDYESEDGEYAVTITVKN